MFPAGTVPLNGATARTFSPRLHRHREIKRRDSAEETLPGTFDSFIFCYFQPSDGHTVRKKEHSNMNSSLNY